MTATSGWCHPDRNHPRDHAECQRRQDTGLLGPCGCRAHGGHEAKESTE